MCDYFCKAEFCRLYFLLRKHLYRFDLYDRYTRNIADCVFCFSGGREARVKVLLGRRIPHLDAHQPAHKRFLLCHEKELTLFGFDLSNRGLGHFNYYLQSDFAIDEWLL